jgi:4-amino-4-deoxy-L-arabinose transferase-like glycosyltransferase
MNARHTTTLTQSPRRTERALLLLILLVAALLRLWQLHSVPPGLTHDEANNVHDAAAVLDGVRPAYFPVAQGKEPLYPYSVALLMALLGPSAWVMRLTSALWGLALVVLSYAWVRRAFGPTIALLTAAWLAVSFWPVTTSRMGLRAITLPVLLTAAVYFLWRGGEWVNGRMGEWANGRKAVLFYTLAGLALGGSFYTYLAARLMPLVLGAFFVYLLTRRQVAWGVLLSLAVAALVAAPLLLYLDAHPSAEIRIGQLDQPLHELLAGKPGLLLDRAGSTLLMFSFRGDTFIPYNLPGKPLLDPFTSILFYAGLALALWRWRQPAYTLALLWLVVGFGPALATGVQAANLRAIAAQPVVYLFPALSLHATGRAIHARLRHTKRSSSVLHLSSFVLLTTIAALTYRDYFTRWSDDRDVRVHCHVDLIAIAQYVRQHPDQTYVISALYPGQYHDPRVVQAELEGDDQHLRWVDGRGAIVLPANDGAAVLPAAERTIAFIVPASVPLDPALQTLLAPDLQHVERVTVRPDDFNPTFDVYHWQGHTMPVHRPGTGQRPLAQVGDKLRLLKADLSATQVIPGDTIELITTWHVNAPLPADREAVLFTQVLDAQGNVVAQQDHLDAPSWNWHPGDQFIQLHRLSLPADLPPGNYRLITGLYTVPDRVDAVLAGHEPDPATPRLPILRDGTPTRDYVELFPLEVVADE